MARPGETDFARDAAQRLKRLGRHYRRQRAAEDRLLGPRTLNEECGVFGIIGTPDAAALTALGLHALQHRGRRRRALRAMTARLSAPSAISGSSPTIFPTPACSPA